jgi:hypothetical protein
MRTLCVAFLFCLASSIANAQYKKFELNKPVSCGPAAQLMEFLEREYNEKQIWIGVDFSASAESFIVVLQNPSNKHFTVVQYDNHTACILGSGIRSTPAPDGESK